MTRVLFLVTALMPAMAAVVGGGVWLGSEAVAGSYGLQCRQGAKVWTDCRMRQLSPGHHWFLEIGADRIEFRHDGSGRMRMRSGQRGSWVSVEPRWDKDQSLCWGTVCARGDVPLD